MATKPVKKAPRKKAEPKKVYIAVGDCDQGDHWEQYRGQEQLDEELPDFIDNCCGDDDCVLVFEVVKVHKIKRKGVELLPGKAP